MTSTDPRPRIVDVAFWAWLVASAVLVFLGVLGAASNAPVFIRGAGVILVIAGLAIGFVGGRTRRGDKRFRRAAVALSMTLAVLVVVFAMIEGGIIWLVPIISLWTGAFAITRPEANKWFDALDRGRDSG
jgi:hypothetical protein